jgi:hypothetical protein
MLAVAEALWPSVKAPYISTEFGAVPTVFIGGGGISTRTEQDQISNSGRLRLRAKLVDLLTLFLASKLQVI